MSQAQVKRTMLSKEVNTLVWRYVQIATEVRLLGFMDSEGCGQSRKWMNLTL
jgi:hypothetical protein